MNAITSATPVAVPSAPVTSTEWSKAHKALLNAAAKRICVPYGFADEVAMIDRQIAALNVKRKAILTAAANDATLYDV